MSFDRGTFNANSTATSTGTAALQDTRGFPRFQNPGLSSQWPSLSTAIHSAAPDRPARKTSC